MSGVRAVLAIGSGYLAAKALDSDRVKRAVHVLRGRPLAYRITIDNGLVVTEDHTRIDTCTVRNTRVAVAQRAPRAEDAHRADHYQYLYEQASEGKCGMSGLTIGACKASICDCFQFPWVKPAPEEHPDPAPAVAEGTHPYVPGPKGGRSFCYRPVIRDGRREECGRADHLSVHSAAVAEGTDVAEAMARLARLAQRAPRAEDVAEAWDRGEYAGREHQKRVMQFASLMGMGPTPTPPRNPYRAQRDATPDGER